jgi:hypothetical protein
MIVMIMMGSPNARIWPEVMNMPLEAVDTSKPDFNSKKRDFYK